MSFLNCFERDLNSFNLLDNEGDIPEFLQQIENAFNDNSKEKKRQQHLDAMLAEWRERMAIVLIAASRCGKKQVLKHQF